MSDLLLTIGHVISSLLEDERPEPRIQKRPVIRPVKAPKPLAPTKPLPETSKPIPEQEMGTTRPSNVGRRAAGAAELVLVKKEFLMGKNLKTLADVYQLGPDALFVKKFLRVFDSTTQREHPSRNLNRLLFQVNGLWTACPQIDNLADAETAYGAYRRVNRSIPLFGDWFRKWRNSNDNVQRQPAHSASH